MGELCAHDSHASARWGIVSGQIIHNPRLSICARMVYTSMATQAEVHGHVEFAQETMARDLGRSRAWVNGGARELERAGLVRIERVFSDGLQRSNRYLLTDGMMKRPGPRIRLEPVAATPEPVGETTPETAEDRDGADGGETGQRRQHVAARRQPADTSHESQIQDSLSQPRRRDFPSMDKSPIGAFAIDPDWRPDDDDLAWAKSRVPDLDTDAFTEAFVLTCVAKNFRYANPGAGWRLWIADPKSPLPLLKPAARQMPLGEFDHASRPSSDQTGPAFRGNMHADSGDISGRNPGHRRTFRRDGGAGRKTFSGSQAGGAFDLAAANASRAHACLERLLGRRADAAPAGYPA
jgi:hypothetical protein